MYVDSWTPHCLLAFRATLTRCPIPLRALVGFLMEFARQWREVAEPVRSGILEMMMR